LEFTFIAEVTNSSNNGLFQCPDAPLSPCRTGPEGMITGDRFQGTMRYDSTTTGLPFSNATEPGPSSPGGSRTENARRSFLASRQLLHDRILAMKCLYLG
jgi:hypothetical protein